MPENYLSLFKFFLDQGHDYVFSLILLDNLDSKVLKSAAGLPFLGASKLGLKLFRNIVELPLKKREKLFKSYQIPTQSFLTMNCPRAIDFITDNKIDLIVNLRTRCIYKAPILNAPRIGCLNIHHGLLPKYRGTLCDLYALVSGRVAGFSIHEMNEKIDAGAIHKVAIVADKEKIKSNNKYDFMDYLKLTEKKEANALLDLLQEIDKLKTFPRGEENSSSDVVFTKNPTRKQISEFIKKGFIL